MNQQMDTRVYIHLLTDVGPGHGFGYYSVLEKPELGRYQAERRNH